MNPSRMARDEAFKQNREIGLRGESLRLAMAHDLAGDWSRDYYVKVVEPTVHRVYDMGCARDAMKLFECDPWYVEVLSPVGSIVSGVFSLLFGWMI